MKTLIIFLMLMNFPKLEAAPGDSAASSFTGGGVTSTPSGSVNPTKPTLKKTKYGDMVFKLNGPGEAPISSEESSKIINEFNTAYEKASPNARPKSYNSKIKITRKDADGKEREVEVSVDFTGNGIQYH